MSYDSDSEHSEPCEQSMLAQRTHTNKIAEINRLNDEYLAVVARIPSAEYEEAFRGYRKVCDDLYVLRTDITARVRYSSELVREWLRALVPDESTPVDVKNARMLLMQIRGIELNF